MYPEAKQKPSACKKKRLWRKDPKRYADGCVFDSHIPNISGSFLDPRPTCGFFLGGVHWTPWACLHLRGAFMTRSQTTGQSWGSRSLVLSAVVGQGKNPLLGLIPSSLHASFALEATQLPVLKRRIPEKNWEGTAGTTISRKD